MSAAKKKPTPDFGLVYAYDVVNALARILFRANSHPKEKGSWFLENFPEPIDGEIRLNGVKLVGDAIEMMWGQDELLDLVNRELAAMLKQSKRREARREAKERREAEAQALAHTTISHAATPAAQRAST